MDEPAVMAAPRPDAPAAPAAPPPSAPAAGTRRFSALLLTGALVAGAAGGAAASQLTQRALLGTAPAAVTATAPAALAVPATAGALSSVLAAAAARVAPAVVRVSTDTGLGSGVVYDTGGLILTNAHVVDGARSIGVVLADGRHLQGEVVGADPGFDLAVIRVQATGLTAAALGSSGALRVGDIVLAVGNPYGYDHTLTLGVVSALDRPVAEGRSSYAQPMIQTDAAINPGNSGGPLVDASGNVVGITTLIAAPQGVPAQGLGFAVPIDTAKRVAPQLASSGHVSASGQPWLGVRISERAGGGVVVREVVAGSPAEAAGLKVDDVVTTVGGREVRTVDELLQVVVTHKPGDRITLAVQRSGTAVSVPVTIGEARSTG